MFNLSKRNVLFSSIGLVVLLTLVFSQYATSARTQEEATDVVNSNIISSITYNPTLSPGVVNPDPRIPEFSWQFLKLRDPSNSEKYFDAAIIPFDRQAAMQTLPPDQSLGTVMDAYGYPPQPNAFTGIREVEGRSNSEIDISNKSGSASRTARPPAFDQGIVRGQVNCRTSPRIAGYFRAFFEDAALRTRIGYDDPQYGAARITAACSALREIGELLKLGQSGVKPTILFKGGRSTLPSYALAAGSTYFGYTVFGEDNGALQQHIVTRVDPRSLNAGEFDAFILTNFGADINWDTDSSLNPHTYSLKTVIAHETFHALGFVSRLPETIPQSNVAIAHGSFEKGFDEDGNSLNPYFDPATALLQAPAGSPSPWFVNDAGVYQGRKNVPRARPDNINPLYTPPTFVPGHSLSHFEMSRAGGQRFLMNPSLATNTVSVAELDEEAVLCHLGYQVAGLAQCELATPVAKDDVMQVSQGSGVSCVNMLEGDVSFEGGTLYLNNVNVISLQPGDALEYFDQVDCTGAPSAAASDATQSIQLTPGPSPVGRVVTYTIMDSVSNRISEPARIFRTNGICTSDPDEYVCNGDFEQPFTPGIFGPGLEGPYPLIPGYFVFDCIGNTVGSNCYVPYWIRGEGSPDIFSSLFDGSNPVWPYSIYTSLPMGNLNSPIGGHNIARILDGPAFGQSASYKEPIITNLKAPLTAGQTYQISYDVTATNLSFPSYNPLGDNIGSARGCIELSVGSSAVHNHCDILQLATGATNYWKHVSYVYTPQVPVQTLKAYGITSAIHSDTYAMGSYIYDNFSIKPVCTVDANSLNVPASMPYSGDGAMTISWNAPGCRTEIYTDSGGMIYAGGPGTSSGTMNFVPGAQSQTDNMVQVTLIAYDATSVKTITKNVVITNLPQPADANQCQISSLTSTSVPAGGGNTTLSWTSPAGCKVSIGKWMVDPSIPLGIRFEQMYTTPGGGTAEFPSSGSKTVPVTEASTFDFVSAKGPLPPNPTIVMWTKFVDVRPQ